MATTSRVLSAAVNGTTYTTNLNDALEAMDTSHSGATAPTDDLVNGKLWLDTTATPSILKMYNNSVWEEIGGSPASPTFAALDVVSASDATLRIKTATTTAASILEFADSADDNIGTVKYDHTQNAMMFITNNSEAMRATYDQKVGIGVTLPATKLEVAGTVTSTGLDVTGVIAVTGDITTDANFVLGTTGNAVIRQDLTDKILTVSGGSANNMGANFRLYGEAHATNPNNFLIRAGTSTELKYDDATSSWDFQANDITTTGTFTGDGSGLTNVGGGWEAYDGGSDATIWDHAVDGDTLSIETPAFTAGYVYRAVMQGVTSDVANRTHYVGLYDGTVWKNGLGADISSTTIFHTSVNDFWDPAATDTQDKLITHQTTRIGTTTGTPSFSAGGGLGVGFTSAKAATKGRFTLNAGSHKSGKIKLYRMAING